MAAAGVTPLPQNHWRTYAVAFPEWMQREMTPTADTMLAMGIWLFTNRLDLWESLRRGDFVENTTVSGDGTSGLFVVDVFGPGRRRLIAVGLGGTLPPVFYDLPIGYQFDTVRDAECKSSWVGRFVPIHLDPIGGSGRLFRIPPGCALRCRPYRGYYLVQTGTTDSATQARFPQTEEEFGSYMGLVPCLVPWEWLHQA